MKVSLLEFTPNPEKVVASAARLCYSASGVDDILQNLNEEKTKSLIKKIVEMGHFSTFEHVSFTFAIEGISRVTTHQLVRHRIASFSQQSQRYVKESAFDYIMPKTIESNILLKKEFEKMMTDIQTLYNKFIEAGISKEDARYLLPNATESKIVFTVNARALLNFFNLRCCQRAQWEIRKVAEKMLEIVQKIAPNLFLKAGASCVSSGICPEGELSCGRLKSQKKTKL